VFSVFGYPLVMIADNGTSFANKLIKASEKLYGYRMQHVMPHTPMANGLAEAAVKKIKLILDRHTQEYTDWHKILPMAQAAVNQRTTTSHNISPFAALFGRQAVTLTALEQPALLPANTPEQRTVQGMAYTMSKLHRRLKQESDDIKEAKLRHDAVAPTRTVECGDKVWLTYSDSERARYIRKHGHGRPWRHPFIVKEVKPHAVRLEVPTDGSVPAVQPWQSLRKCSFAAPHFHDDTMPLPALDPRGIPLVDQIARATNVDDPLEVPVNDHRLEEDPMGPNDWTRDKEYEIERIVSATISGRGWILSVKWKDFPDATPEATSP